MTRKELEIAIKKAKDKGKDLVISVNTESEFNELMTKCEKLGMCTLAKSYDYYKRKYDNDEKLCVRFVGIGGCYYSGENWYKENGFEIVPFNKKDETIVIYRKGDDVIALNKAAGKQAKATCSKDDEFVFETGAKLAFERLLGEEPRGIQVGDTVRVINNGVSYITYIDFFKKHNIDKSLEHYAYGHKPKDGFMGKVVYISGSMVVIKEDNIYGCGKIYLIDKRGLEKV